MGPLIQPSPDVIRREDKSGYVTPLGPQPGVTTVLGATKTEDQKARLQAWLDRPGNDRVRDGAAQRGTWLHEMTENWLCSRVHQPPLHTMPEAAAFVSKPYFRSMKRWLDANVHSPLAIEIPLWHPDGYAGTCDAALWTYDHTDAVLCDWKTSFRRRSGDLVHDYRVQVAAYRRAMRWTYGEEFESGYIVIARPAGEPQVSAISPAEMDVLEEEFCERLKLFQEQRCITPPTQLPPTP